MEHFDLLQWADFVRHLLPKSDSEKMQHHLASGCKRCTNSERLLRQVAVSAAADLQYEVPRYARDNARSIAALQRPERVSFSRMLASLVFDSFGQQPLTGVRAEQQERTRQALYQAGDVCIDVRIEQERESGLVSLIGQINDRRKPAQGMAGVPVVLRSRKKIIAHAVSNRSGEFQLEYRRRNDLRLHLLVSEIHSEIEVQLSDSARP